MTKKKGSAQRQKIAVVAANEQTTDSTDTGVIPVQAVEPHPEQRAELLKSLTDDVNHHTAKLEEQLCLVKRNQCDHLAVFERLSTIESAATTRVFAQAAKLVGSTASMDEIRSLIDDEMHRRALYPNVNASPLGVIVRGLELAAWAEFAHRIRWTYYLGDSPYSKAPTAKKGF